MSSVPIPAGSALAAKVFGAAVFNRVQLEPGFMNLLSGPAPKLSDAAAKMKGQSSPDFPIVKVMDLATKAGSRVSVDLFNPFKGKPVMGDNKLAGRGMRTTTSSMDIEINRTRQMADNGGTMTQKRTVHDLRMLVRAGLTGWAQKVEDQRCMVQLAGARGGQDHTDWQVPLDTDPDYNTIMVNTVRPPTKNRRFLAGTATSFADMTVSDYLTLGDVASIAAQVQEGTVPLQPINFPGDKYGWTDPLWVLLVTERQWHIIKHNVSSAFVRAAADAVKRFDGNKAHPLFSGDGILWNNVLIKPLFKRYAIRFATGTTANAVDNGTNGTVSAGSETVAANITVDRALLLGAQALVKAYGNEGSDSYFYRWNEELTDHKSVVEISLSMMEGTAKPTFAIDSTDSSGVLAAWNTDIGVAVIDSYAPALGTAAMNTAITTAGRP
jgi:N4-gp56 family major capsid protein